MCQKCIDLARKYFQGKTDEDYNTLLWGATAFPFCDPDHLDGQLKDLAEKSSGDINMCLAIADAEIGQAHEEMTRKRAETMVSELKAGDVWERYETDEWGWKNGERKILDVTDKAVLYEEIQPQTDGTTTASLPEPVIKQATYREWYSWADLARKK